MEIEMVPNLVYSNCWDEMKVTPLERSLVYSTVSLMDLQSVTRMAWTKAKLMAHLTEMQRVNQTEMSLDQLMDV